MAVTLASIVNEIEFMPTTPLTWRLETRFKKELDFEAIKKALAKANKGEFISLKAMHKWMDSWGTENEVSAPKPDLFL